MAICNFCAVFNWYIIVVHEEMMSFHLTLLPMTFENLPSSFANECFPNFLCWLSFIRILLSISAAVDGSIMEVLTFSSQPGEDLTSNLYQPSVTSRPENRYVSYMYVKFYKMSISSRGIILDLFSMALYLVV